MPEKQIKLSALKIRQRAEIVSFDDHELSLKLLEMGCLPGEIIEVTAIAPLGDPIAILVSGYILGIGKSEASKINVIISQ